LFGRQQRHTVPINADSTAITSDPWYDVAIMSWQHIRIRRFGGPEVLELAEQPSIPEPGPGEVRIKILAAGTGFTDSFIRRGRYPGFKGPLPFTPGYELVGVVDKTGPRRSCGARG
jgi:D-arabinose 1-dehydrogenase-like Zn-dependent alcohol dehydrogenase